VEAHPVLSPAPSGAGFCFWSGSRKVFVSVTIPA
jgi:hypothetical protein